MPGSGSCLARWVQTIGFLTALPVCLYWIRRWRTWPARHLPRRPERLLPPRSGNSLVASPAAVLRLRPLLLHHPRRHRRRLLPRPRLGRLVDRPRNQTRPPTDPPSRIWDPRQLVGLVLRPQQPQAPPVGLHPALLHLRSSAAIFLLLTRLTGCSVYESPLGGGEEKQLRQIVKIQKVINKKYVINPYSSVLFNPPPDRRRQTPGARSHRAPLQDRPRQGRGRRILRRHHPRQGPLHPPQIRRRRLGPGHGPRLRPQPAHRIRRPHRPPGQRPPRADGDRPPQEFPRPQEPADGLHDRPAEHQRQRCARSRSSATISSNTTACSSATMAAAPAGTASSSR